MKYCVPFGACFRAYICSHHAVLILITSSLLLFILIGYLPLVLEQRLAMGILAGALLYLSLIDIKRRLLPDRIVLPLLWLGLLLNAYGLFTTAEQAILGAATGYVCLYAINVLYRLFRQQDGMGYGDVKLFAALGAWAGVQALPIVLVLAAGLGLLTFMVRGGLRWCVSSSIESANFQNESQYERHLRGPSLPEEEYAGKGRRSKRDVSVPCGGESLIKEGDAHAYLKEGIPFGPSLACAGWGYLVISTSGGDVTPFLFANAFQ